MMRAARDILPALLVASMLSAPYARAQTSAQDARMLAETLFREGRRLMDEGRYSEGCRKLEESLRLDPAAGTLLALATCHENEGRYASASGEFTQVIATARREGRADRETFAKEHLASLEPLVPKVIIEVPAPSRVKDLKVTRNGTELTDTAWGLELPADPGDVVVVAQAPQYKSWTFTGKVGKGDRLRIAVPALEAAPTPPPDANDTTKGAEGKFDATPVRSGHDYRVPAYVLGGVGVVALGIGTYLGLHALSKQKESDDNCPQVGGVRSCTQAGVDANGSALTNAHWADATLGIGLAAVAAGVVLYVISTPAEKGAPAASGEVAAPAKATFRISPSAGPHGGGATILGTF